MDTLAVSGTRDRIREIDTYLPDTAEGISTLGTRLATRKKVDEKVGRESGGGIQDSQKACMLVSLVRWCLGGRAYGFDLLSSVTPAESSLFSADILPYLPRYLLPPVFDQTSGNNSYRTLSSSPRCVAGSAASLA